MGPTDSTAKLQADALADGNTRKSHGGSRICADAAAFVAADLDADRGADSDRGADPRLQPYVPRDLQADGRGDSGAELPHAGPHDYAAKLRTVEIAHSVAHDAANAPAEL